MVNGPLIIGLTVIIGLISAFLFGIELTAAIAIGAFIGLFIIYGGVCLIESHLYGVKG